MVGTKILSNETLEVTLFLDTFKVWIYDKKEFKIISLDIDDFEKMITNFSKFSDANKTSHQSNQDFEDLKNRVHSELKK